MSYSQQIQQAQIQQAQQPKLRPIQMPKQAYPLDSRPESAEDLLNLFSEIETLESRSRMILRSTPGAVVYQQFGTGPVSALADLHGFLYMVSGDKAFRVIADGTAMLLGTVLFVQSSTIAIGPTQVVICTPPNAYYAAHDGTLTQITGTSLPGFSSVAYLDGYFVFTVAGTGQFAVSKLLSASVIDPLDFASQQAMPDVVERGVTHNGVYWLFGADVIEVWYDAGAADFPFRRQLGAEIYAGTTAPASIARLDNGLCWLARDNIVYHTQGFQAKRISTHALEQTMKTYGDTTNAQGCSYTQEGHQFYALTFPAANSGNGATWVYDAATELWHRRSSFPSGVGRWRAQTAAQFGQSAVIGDFGSGKVFFLAPNVATDDSTVMPRVAVFPPITAAQARVFMHRLEIEMETGTGTTPDTLTVDWSDDGGTTFKPPRTLNVVPGSRVRPYTTVMGSFRERVLRLNASGYMTVYAADADMNVGVT